MTDLRRPSAETRRAEGLIVHGEGANMKVIHGLARDETLGARTLLGISWHRY